MPTDLLSNVYIACLILAGGMLVISFLGMETHHLDDIGGFGHEIDGLLGELGIHLGNLDDRALAALNPISLRNFMAFLATFGAVGTLNVAQGASPQGTFGLCLLIAAVVTILVWVFTILVYSQSGNTVVKESDYRGLSAKVITPISADHMGQVQLIVGGQIQTLPARSLEETDFRMGDQVLIHENQEGVLIVTRVYSLEDRPQPKQLPPVS